MAETGGCGCGTEVPALDVVGWALPCATASAVGCGLWKLPHQVSGVQMLPGAKCSIFVIYIPHFHLFSSALLPRFDGCVSGFLSLPPTATADTAERRDDLSESGVTQTCCCLGMVLERKRNFISFFIHEIKDVGGLNIFLVLSSCLGKNLNLLLLTSQEMKRKGAHGLENEHLLAITLFQVRHQRTCWCY